MHPTPVDLLNAALGDAPPKVAYQVHMHLPSCGSCQHDQYLLLATYNQFVHASAFFSATIGVPINPLDIAHGARNN